jgi:peptide chain release factor 1
MIPPEKLDQIRGRFEYLEARLTAGVSPDDLPRLSREYAELKPVVDAIQAYRRLGRELEEVRRLETDPEMRGLAEEELRRILSEIPAAEQVAEARAAPQGRGRQQVGDHGDPRRHGRRGGGTLRG